MVILIPAVPEAARVVLQKALQAKDVVYYTSKIWDEEMEERI